MKKLCFILVFPAIWIACDSSRSSHQSVPGTYVSQWENNFGTVSDTLLVEPDASGSGYSIIRATAHFRRLQGQPADTTHKRVRFAGSFNESSKSMQLDDPSKMLTFADDGNTVKITGNENPYTRIR